MRILVLLIVVLALAGCSGPDESNGAVSADASPVDVTGDWVEAVAAGDIADLERLVEPIGLAVVAAVENDLRSDELAGLLVGGMPADLQTQYWITFREDFGAIRGSSFDQIVVGREVAVPGLADFTSVEISNDGIIGRVVLRRTDLGWQVDFAATVGPALIGPLGEYLESALAGDHGVVIADSYRTAVLPGLEAAIAVGDNNSVLVFETEFIRQLSEL